MLIHGAGGGAWEWNRWRGVLEAHAIAVHALELKPVPQGLSATTLQDYLAQTQGALQELQRPRVLIGASMGGLLAARALSDFYAVVTVLERDTFPRSDIPRKGVPLGRQAHSLLVCGRIAPGANHHLNSSINAFQPCTSLPIHSTTPSAAR